MSPCETGGPLVFLRSEPPIEGRQLYLRFAFQNYLFFVLLCFILLALKNMDLSRLVSFWFSSCLARAHQGMRVIPSLPAEHQQVLLFSRG